jgi:type I restriction enzyme M protein
MAIEKAMRQIEKANPDTLFGIFGDAQWTNKDRLSDETLINLMEHFSSETLSIKNVPNDELGQGYEFLIKKFADDSGHTAAEFYTNRTVVQLMTLIMDPKLSQSMTRLAALAACFCRVLISLKQMAKNIVLLNFMVKN